MTIKLVIVGGVAGGATAAARARRLDERAEIIVFERGEYISFANCGLPYYIGQVIKKRNSLLVTTAEALNKRYHIDVRVLSEVTGIDRENKQVAVRSLQTGESYNETYDKLILSPGAEPVRPNMPGSDLETVFTLRNIADTDRIKAYVDDKKSASAVVVGGGYIGLEMAENLAARGVKTTIVEMLDQVMAPLDYEMAAMVHGHLEEKGVDLQLKKTVKSLSQKNHRTIVVVADGNEIECDLVILSIGVRPENKLAREAGLEIGHRGGIKIDSGMKTSDPDIFAVGDAVEIRDYVTGLPTMMALAGPANKQGRIAADNALGRNSKYKGAQGTAIVKVFDMTVASTGAGEKTLKQNHIPYLTSYTHSDSHASYYPQAKMLSIKLVFSPNDGRVLGAQIVGKDGVDKRIDVLATAIRGKMTVFDLEELELAYAPPYSSAKDPVNIAGFVAANILKGDIKTVSWNQLGELDKNDYLLIDVRNKEELEKSGRMDGARHIPINELRERLGELNKNKKYIAVCAAGQRAYIGCRMLAQTGFDARNLSGGFITYSNAMRKK